MPLMEANATPGPGRVRLPDGVHDFPPARAASLKARLDEIVAAIELAGYARIFSPTFELFDVLAPGLGETARRSSFKSVDPASGEVIVLRPDFTAQVARMVSARLSDMQRPLRLYYSGRVARVSDPFGRDLHSRDFFQAGVELIGPSATWADVEVLCTAADVFDRLGTPVTITLGHAAFVDALLGPDRDEASVRQALSVKDRREVARLAPEVVPLLDLYGDADVLAEARKALRGAPEAVGAAIDRLEALAAAVAANAPSQRLTFDLGEQRSLGYYTGMFFHGYVEGAPDAVLSGGRYDELLARFGAREPAVGFAIDVGALPAGPASANGSGVVVATDDPASPAVRSAVAARRKRGERCATAPIAEAEAYAKAHGFRAVVASDDPIE